MASGMAGKLDEIVGGLGRKVLELSQDKWMKLALSILIDLIGILSYIIPVVRRWMNALHTFILSGLYCTLSQSLGLAVPSTSLCVHGQRGPRASRWNAVRKTGKARLILVFLTRNSCPRPALVYDTTAGRDHRRVLGTAVGAAGVPALRELPP